MMPFVIWTFGIHAKFLQLIDQAGKGHFDGLHLGTLESRRLFPEIISNPGNIQRYWVYVLGCFHIERSEPLEEPLYVPELPYCKQRQFHINTEFILVLADFAY